MVKYGRGEHPNSKKNIANRNVFSSENQPPIYRNKVTMLTDLLIDQLKRPMRIVVDAQDAVSKKWIKAVIDQPTKEVIVGALLRAAADGNVKAIDMVFDRIEGKIPLPIEVDPSGNRPNPTQAELSTGELVDII